MRILLVTSSLPWPLERDGGGQRMGHLLAALRRHGPVDLLFVNEQRTIGLTEHVVRCMGQATRVIGDLATGLQDPAGAVPPRAPRPGRLRRAAMAWTHLASRVRPDDAVVDWMRSHIAPAQYDLIVARHLFCGVCVRAAVGPEKPVLLDFDDVDWLVRRARQARARSGSLAARLWQELGTWRLERVCRRAIGTFDHVWVAGPEDRRAVGPHACTVLPNIPLAVEPGRHRPLPPSRADSRTLLFVGRLSYSPNVYGIEHFLGAVWPAVRSRCPASELRIAGTRLTEARRQAWSAHPGVHVVGFVEDLEQEYADCALTIAPVYWGGGTKIKVLDSLSWGRTCVATPHALHGYGGRLKHGECAWCAGTDLEFAEGCVVLLEDAARRADMETRGAQAVARHFNVDVFNRAVDAPLAGVEKKTKTGAGI